MTTDAPTESEPFPETYIYLYKHADGTRGTNAVRLAEAYLQNALPNYISREAREFAGAVLIPRVAKQIESDAHGQLRLEGKMAAHQLATNLRMTWGAQSYGGTFVHQVMNFLIRSMRKMGYTDQEIQAGIQNIFILSISGAMPVRVEGPSPTVVFIEDEKDYIALVASRKGIHPRDTQDADGIAQENKREVLIDSNRRFFWHAGPSSDLKALSEPVYGYHDERLTLTRMSPKAKRAWLRALKTEGTLPSLEDLLSSVFRSEARDFTAADGRGTQDAIQLRQTSRVGHQPSLRRSEARSIRLDEPLPVQVRIAASEEQKLIAGDGAAEPLLYPGTAKFVTSSTPYVDDRSPPSEKQILRESGETYIFVDLAAPRDSPKEVAEGLARWAEAGAKILSYNAAKVREARRTATGRPGHSLLEWLKGFELTNIRQPFPGSFTQLLKVGGFKALLHTSILLPFYR